jgi:hypothetical protein
MGQSMEMGTIHAGDFVVLHIFILKFKLTLVQIIHATAALSFHHSGSSFVLFALGMQN